MRRIQIAFALSCLLVSAIGRPIPAHAEEGAGLPRLQLVESYPIETSLDDPAIPEAFEVWKEMIDGAERSLEFAEFYASDEPGSHLDPIVAAVEAAADRGVRVRFLAEKKFYATYPQTIDRLRSHAGIETRIYDVAALTGGVLHAKYFIVDRREVYMGSQNFDWRSLTHIQELGVRVRQDAVVAEFGDVFDTDWGLAGGAPEAFRAHEARDAEAFPVAIVEGSDTLHVTPVFSPEGWLPDASLWDLPRIVKMIDSARATVRVQLLTYKASGGRKFFAELEDALRAAAARGVRVELLLSDWCMRKGTIEGLQSLQALPGIDVRLVTIPQWSGGFIPFARVIHAKYMVVDDRSAWVGTSNWEWDYFHRSRNVGLIIAGAGIARDLNAHFDRVWNGTYAVPLDPCVRYTPPRIGE